MARINRVGGLERLGLGTRGESCENAAQKTTRSRETANLTHSGRGLRFAACRLLLATGVAAACSQKISFKERIVPLQGKGAATIKALPRWVIPCLGDSSGASIEPVPSPRNAKWSPDGGCGGAVRADFRRNCRMGVRFRAGFRFGVGTPLCLFPKRATTSWVDGVFPDSNVDGVSAWAGCHSAAWMTDLVVEITPPFPAVDRVDFDRSQECSVR